MPATVIIPSRYASSRFPGKPLATILGKPMIQHVYERARGAKLVDEVWVATDDRRIEEAVRAFGGDVVRTKPDHPNGTHRVIEASRRLSGDLLINLQGDEPLILPEQIDRVVEILQTDNDADIGTLRVASVDPDEILDPNNVKVVTDHRGYALYFSRAPIPFYQDSGPTAGRDPAGSKGWGTAWIHVGIYGFRRAILEALPSLPPSPWEDAEKLEQLRFIYWGYRIRLAETEYRTMGVDVPEDISRAEKAMEAQEASDLFRSVHHHGSPMREEG